MTQTLRIDLPIVAVEKDGLTLVEAIGFPAFSTAAGNRDIAIKRLRKRIRRHLLKEATPALVQGLVRGAVKRRRLCVEFSPKEKMRGWREPITVELDVLTWPNDQGMTMAWVPAVSLRLAASSKSDLETLLREQIRSAIRRSDHWSLPGLLGITSDHGPLMQTRQESVQLLRSQLTVQLPTPAELQRRECEAVGQSGSTPTLKAVATRLKPSTLPDAYHCEESVASLDRMLLGAASRSVLLVGPSGVGKTAAFHQWVKSESTSAAVWSTDGARLISGQSGFGMWQEQCLKLAEEANRTKAIVHFGNLVEFCESGKAWGSGGCGALLAPRIGEGSLLAVCECTREQLMRMTRTEPRLIEAFTEVRMAEPSPSRCRDILLETATSWRQTDVSKELRKRSKRTRSTKPGKVSEAPRKTSVPAKTSNPTRVPAVSMESLEILDRLHRRFPTDAAMPGRALALFRSLMSERMQHSDESNDLSPANVIEAFGRQTGLPRFLIDDGVRPDLDAIQRQLKSEVIGQDEPIETLVDLVAVIAADVARGDRPLSSMLMIGPTGVGKTETAKALARLIYSDVSRLVRLDLSEFGDASAVGRLIGGYSNPDGVLTSPVQAQPFSLILLDEFEKAHSSVFDLLLQVLGEGRLTDSRGRVADFRNAIIMMTSNLGVDSFRERPLGLADSSGKTRYRQHFEKQVREFLRPEMFNRIDRVLTFDPLDRIAVESIAHRQIDLLQQRDGWRDQIAQLDLDDGVVDYLVSQGYQPQYGARALSRVIDQELVTPIAAHLSEPKSQANRSKMHLKASVSSGQIEISGKSVEQTSTKNRPRTDNDAADKKLTELIDLVTRLRRQAQKLTRCTAVHRLRNRHTLLSRKINRQLAKTKDKAKRQQIANTGIAIERDAVAKQLQSISNLGESIEALEDETLMAHFRDAPYDVLAGNEQRLQLIDQMDATLGELVMQSSASRDRMTLIISGANLATCAPLLLAYRDVAEAKHFDLQVHALRRQRDRNADLLINDNGWRGRPAFTLRVPKTSPDPEALLIEQDLLAEFVATRDSMDESADEPDLRLNAYRLEQSEHLTSAPAETVALMLTFRGEGAAILLGGENGVHSFRGLQSSPGKGVSFLVTTFDQIPADYVPPAWMAKADFQYDAHSRRMYDVQQQLTQDLHLSNSRTVKMTRGGLMSRSGSWLEPLLNEEARRRVWAVLDD